MQKLINRFDAVGWGIECPTCHTVYFLECPLNRDRMYHSPREDGRERWTLLCICSEQISFQKDGIKRYATHKAALDLGYAIKGQRQRLSEVQWQRLSGILDAFADAFGLSTREFFQISEFLKESKAAEKRRH